MLLASIITHISKAASFIRPTTFHALGFSLLVSNNMMDGLERVQRFYRILGDAIKISFTQLGDQVVISVDPASDELLPSAHAIDMTMASTLVFARQYVSRELSPARLELMRPKPGNPKKHQAFFNCEVKFNQNSNRLKKTN